MFFLNHKPTTKQAQPALRLVPAWFNGMQQFTLNRGSIDAKLGVLGEK